MSYYLITSYMDDHEKRHILELFRKNSPLYIPATLTFEKQPGHMSFHLLHGDSQFSHFMFFVRKSRKLSEHKGYLYLSKNTLLVGSSTIRQVYDQFKSSDDFLHIIVTEERMFGY